MLLSDTDCTALEANHENSKDDVGSAYLCTSRHCKDKDKIRGMK